MGFKNWDELIEHFNKEDEKELFMSEADRKKACEELGIKYTGPSK